MIQVPFEALKERNDNVERDQTPKDCFKPLLDRIGNRLFEMKVIKLGRRLKVSCCKRCMACVEARLGYEEANVNRIHMHVRAKLKQRLYQRYQRASH